MEQDGVRLMPQNKTVKMLSVGTQVLGYWPKLKRVPIFRFIQQKQ